MNNYTKYINALRKCAKEHENDLTPFAHIIVSDLCSDVADLLESLEQELVLDKIKAEIFNACSDNYHMPVYNLSCEEIFEILDKYKAESEQ